MNGAERGAPNAPIHRLIAHWINLPSIFSTLRLATEDACWNGRWQAEIDGWNLIIDRRSDYNTAMHDIAHGPAFVMTHVMQVRRVDDATFDPEHAKRILDDLRVCFSFVFGRSMAPALPVGYDPTGEVVWEEWTAPICDPAKQVDMGWLHPIHADDLIEFLRCALPTLADPAHRDSLRLQMILAIQTVGTGLLEQRILTAFPALENLQRITLVLGGQVTPKQYGNSNNWPGHKRLRRLLQQARIPCEIDPTELPVLAAFAAAENHADGPAAVVNVRNKIVHPKRALGDIHRFDGLTVDAWLLTRHYLTLLILHSVNYQGSFVRLLPPFGRATHSHRVPWVQQP
ncbi:MAG: hypothetical protein M3548_08555 [Actinomycetota bacterium]|nr:hypothetical protein [Actinomycetota bacterium]